jgi:MerR family transcriptional regulator, light-induced transcriptional regulator
MQGSRPPHGAGGNARGGFHKKSATMLEKIYFDHIGQHHERISVHSEPNLDGQLGNVIAGEIVPRLMLLHKGERARSQAAAPPNRAVELSAQVADFTELVMHHEHDVLEAYVKSLLQRGLNLEALLLHLLAPAARRLGALWEEDKVDFVDVTIATSRLQQLLHHFTLELKKKDDGRRAALFVAAPHEQHTFGLVMVSEFFRREGWQVHGGVAMEGEELRTVIAEQSFALIGFSLSCDRLINTLCSTIQSVRRLSKNQSVLVMVGGRIFAQDPAQRPWVGADIVAADAREAIDLAEHAVRARAWPRGPHNR